MTMHYCLMNLLARPADIEKPLIGLERCGCLGFEDSFQTFRLCFRPTNPSDVGCHVVRKYTLEKSAAMKL